MTLSELWNNISSGGLHRERDEERAQKAQSLSRGNGYGGTVTLAEIMASSPRYGRYMNRLGQDDWLGVKDSATAQKMEKDMGEPIPDYFWQRYWLNQVMQERQKGLYNLYRQGGI